MHPRHHSVVLRPAQPGLQVWEVQARTLSLWIEVSLTPGDLAIHKIKANHHCRKTTSSSCITKQQFCMIPFLRSLRNTQEFQEGKSTLLKPPLWQRVKYLGCQWWPLERNKVAIRGSKVGQGESGKDQSMLIPTGITNISTPFDSL